MKPHRYYCLSRPPAPGAIPKGAIDTRDYGERRWEDDIGRWVWGWADYSYPLTPQAIDQYELMPAIE